MFVKVLDTARHAAKALLEPLVWPVQRVRQEAHERPVMPLLLLVVLILCIVRAIKGDRLAALVLVPLSFAWVLFNGPLEGPTLLVVSSSHGITVSDLISLFGLLIAGWRLTPVLVGR
jgi:hypothetical protein